MADVIPLYRVLSLEALDAAKDWEAALSLPLPKNPGIELLNRARTEVLIYLDFVTNDAAQSGDVSAEINRAAARLIEISQHWGPAIDDNVQAHLAAERAEREREWRDWLAKRPFGPDLNLVPPEPK
jgi:hypothetical protein